MRVLCKLSALTASLCLPAVAWSASLSLNGGCSVAVNAVDSATCFPAPPAEQYVPGTVISSSATTGIAESSYGVRANYGNVGVFLEATTQASSGEVSARSDATATAGFADEVLVTSDTLAVGTPVLATATFIVNGRAQAESTSIIGKVTADAFAFLYASYAISGTGGTLLQFSACSSSLPSFTAGCSSVYTSDSATYSLTFETSVGSLLSVQGDIYGSVHAGVGANSDAGPVPMSFGILSALNSSHTYLDAAGAHFVGSAGVDYALPVPEPASAVLILAGLAILSSQTAVARTTKTRRWTTKP